jgi:hypothetical protein
MIAALMISAKPLHSSLQEEREKEQYEERRNKMNSSRRTVEEELQARRDRPIQPSVDRTSQSTQRMEQHRTSSIKQEQEERDKGHDPDQILAAFCVNTCLASNTARLTMIKTTTGERE